MRVDSPLQLMVVCHFFFLSLSLPCLPVGILMAGTSISITVMSSAMPDESGIKLKKLFFFNVLPKRQKDGTK